MFFRLDRNFEIFSLFNVQNLITVYPDFKIDKFKLCENIPDTGSIDLRNLKLLNISIKLYFQIWQQRKFQIYYFTGFKLAYQSGMHFYESKFINYLFTIKHFVLCVLESFSEQFVIQYFQHSKVMYIRNNISVLLQQKQLNVCLDKRFKKLFY